MSKFGSPNLISMLTYPSSSIYKLYSAYLNLKSLGFVVDGDILIPNDINISDTIDVCHDKTIFDYIEEAISILEKGIDLKSAGQGLGCFQFPTQGKEYDGVDSAILYKTFKKHYEETEKSSSYYASKFNMEHVCRTALNTLMWDYLKSKHHIVNISTTVDNGSIIFVVNYTKDSGLVTFADMMLIVDEFNQSLPEFLNQYFDNNHIRLVYKKFDKYYKRLIKHKPKGNHDSSKSGDVISRS